MAGTVFFLLLPREYGYGSETTCIAGVVLQEFSIGVSGVRDLVLLVYPRTDG